MEQELSVQYPCTVYIQANLKPNVKNYNKERMVFKVLLDAYREILRAQAGNEIEGLLKIELPVMGNAALEELSSKLTDDFFSAIKSYDFVNGRSLAILTHWDSTASMENFYKMNPMHQKFEEAAKAQLSLMDLIVVQYLGDSGGQVNHRKISQ